MKAKTELPKNERSEFKEEFLDQLIERTISRTNRLIKVSKLSKKTLDGAHDAWLQESSGPGKKHAAGTTPTPMSDSQSLDTNMTTSRRSDTDTTHNKGDLKGTGTKGGSSRTDTSAPTEMKCK